MYTIYHSARKKSEKVISKTFPNVIFPLPLLDELKQVKVVEEIIERVLILNVIVSVSFGFDEKLALEWLKNENLISKLTAKELTFINNPTEELCNFYQISVESLYAFGWVLNFRKKIDPNKLCDNNLYKIFPDLNNMESSQNFRELSKLRSIKEIIEATDLYYCAHWCLIEYKNNQELGYVITERRKVLEWIYGNVEWNDVSLDT